GPAGARGEGVANAAEAAGPTDLIGPLPDGSEPVLTERGSSLPGGQRQGVAIARALVRRTPILLLDDPTTGLDPASRRGVIAALQRLMHGSTTLVVTHDMELARNADEIIVLGRGRPVDRGTYEELTERSPEVPAPA